jgi:hypothetical protein
MKSSERDDLSFSYLVGRIGFDRIYLKTFYYTMVCQLDLLLVSNQNTKSVNAFRH